MFRLTDWQPGLQSGNTALAEALALQRPWKLLKGGKDETPSKVKDRNGCLETRGVLNCMVNIRWGEDDMSSACVPALPAEMLTADTAGLIDTLQRICPSQWVSCAKLSEHPRSLCSSSSVIHAK